MFSGVSSHWITSWILFQSSMCVCVRLFVCVCARVCVCLCLCVCSFLSDELSISTVPWQGAQAIDLDGAQAITIPFGTHYLRDTRQLENLAKCEVSHQFQLSNLSTWGFHTSFLIELELSFFHVVWLFIGPWITVAGSTTAFRLDPSISSPHFAASTHL